MSTETFPPKGWRWRIWERTMPDAPLETRIAYFKHMAVGHGPSAGTPDLVAYIRELEERLRSRN